MTGELEITVSEEKHDSHAMTDMGEVTVELGATVTAAPRGKRVSYISCGGA